MDGLIELKHRIGRIARGFLSKSKDTIAKMRGCSIRKKAFTIISDNCWGGFVYQRYGIEYQSPTIGLFFYPEDYISFLENLEYYLAQPLVVKDRSYSKYAHIQPDRQYPVGFLDDVELQLLHFHSAQEAQEKWERRKKRICFDRCLIKMSNRSSLFTDDIYERFGKLPFKNKVLFTYEKKPYPFCVYVPEFEDIIDTNISEIPYTLRKISLREMLNEL